MRGYYGIGLWNPKNPVNVGSTLRACMCFGASFLMIQGRCFTKMKHAADTCKAWKHIPVYNVENLIDSIPYDCVPVCVEFIQESKSLIEFKHYERALYIFWPEDGSVPPKIQERCAQTIYIPSDYCLNLAAAVNVILYDRRAKFSA